MILSYSLGGRIVIKSEDDLQWVKIASDATVLLIIQLNFHFFTRCFFFNIYEKSQLDSSRIEFGFEKKNDASVR